jgi:DNA-binding MarR family transcriptional regulator
MTDRGGDGVARSPLHLFHRASQCAELVFEGVMKRGLTPRQLDVMRTVAAHEGLSQTDVVARTGIDRSTMADVVRRLAGKGWLQRRRSKSDSRAYVLKLTEKGKSILGVAEPFAKGVDARVLNALPKDRREVFMVSLLAVIEAMEARAMAPSRRRPGARAAHAGEARAG